MRLEHSRLRDINRSEVIELRVKGDIGLEPIAGTDIEREADVWTALDVRQALSAMYLGRWRRDGDQEIWEAIQIARAAIERLVTMMLRRKRAS